MRVARLVVGVLPIALAVACGQADEVVDRPPGRAPAAAGTAPAPDTGGVVSITDGTQARLPGVAIGAGNFGNDRSTPSGEVVPGPSAGLWIRVEGDSGEGRTVRVRPGSVFTAASRRFEVLEVTVSNRGGGAPGGGRSVVRLRYAPPHASGTEGRASASSWAHRPMPAATARLALEASYDSAEFAAISRGLVPASMDDHWFVFEENGVVSIHRSWTGIAVYRVGFERAGDRYRAVEALVNRDPDQMTTAPDPAAELRQLRFLLDGVLLGKAAR